MKQSKDEQFFEQECNKMIRGQGVWCGHLETSVPGFPDTLVAGKQTMFIEYKIGKLSKKLIEAYEPAQLRVHRDLHNSGAFVITALISKSGTVYIFESGEMLDEAVQMLGAKFDDFAYSFNTIQDFTNMVVSYAKGEISREGFILR